MFELEPLQSSDRVYRLLNPDGLDLYLTAIRDCGTAREHVSAAATTRQLIVGLKNLRIMHQEPRSVAGNVMLVSSLKAELEDTPLRIECYTLRRGECTFDLVGWERMTPGGSDTYPYFPGALAYLEEALPGIVQ